MDAPLTTTTTTTSTKSFRGKQYWKPGVTQAVRTILETPFARFQVHSIQLGDDNRKIIDDWLWFDESDHVNVLVQSRGETEDEEEGTFIVLEQTKYAIEGSTYAVVGGMIEMDRDHNDPLAAAQREVLEELNMEATTWKKLGTFVVSANRGGGTTHVFWAQDAQPRRMDNQKPSNIHIQKSGGGGGGEGRIADGELERQSVVRLSRKELLDALLNGKFKEIKWTATVALALLDHTRENPNVL
jgi:8-oxo-dGTP pyrophosphatase MutT (NUDIX family)